MATKTLTSIRLFTRQTVNELKKVIWPTRRELITYTSAVLAFVAAAGILIATIDYLATRGVLLLFG